MCDEFTNKEGLEQLDDLLISAPHVYAFSTPEPKKLQGYLKVGGAHKQPVNTRINQWKKAYPNLDVKRRIKARVDYDSYFKDYSVHSYLVNSEKKERLEKNDKEKIYSNEFFKATVEDIDNAVEDIKAVYNKEKENENDYTFYDAIKDEKKEKTIKRSTEPWELRPLQEEAVKKFEKAWNEGKDGKKNLLMYAVMRFGKSFTAMTCAQKMHANFVVVVSAKADVKDEWENTVMAPLNFSEYKFISYKKIKSEYNNDNPHLIKKLLNAGQKIVVFITLQSLMPKKEENELKIKEEYQDIFNNQIDMLIVDETHFAARAPVYGYSIQNNNSKIVNKKYEDEDEEEYTLEDADNTLKPLDAKVTLHVSGTPYRILMSNEFTDENIICRCEYSDIVHAQSKWEDDNRADLENGKMKFWDNPYYGFPKMIIFAFNLSKNAQKKLETFKRDGNFYAFSELFRPKSTKKDKDELYREFVNEDEVLELFKSIDGSNDDENVLGFLDYEKMTEDCEMCRHIVCVLPYCASCDALEKLLTGDEHKNDFTNLKNYQIVNISGIGKHPTANKVKATIKNAEKDHKKTLTLTVNRMLTGATVPEWDTMIYLKDTHSAEAYYQAIYRIQNQYIEKTNKRTDLISNEGENIKNDEDELVINRKPQTLLVDFDPCRVFSMQEEKAQISNYINHTSGNENVNNRIISDLKISPIITMNKNKIGLATAENITDYISQYSKEKGVMEETLSIPVDTELMSDPEIYNEISRQQEIGSSGGFATNAFKNGDEDIDLSKDKGNETKGDSKTGEDNQDDGGNGKAKGKDKKKEFENKFRTYYARILFYAFLVEDNVKTLSDIIKSMSSDKNCTIAINLGIRPDFLQKFRSSIKCYPLSQLDRKIANISKLAKDTQLEPLERVNRALKSFTRLSKSEITTPQDTCKEMIANLPADELNRICDNNGRFLDIASKTGEFAIAIYDRLINDLGREHNDIKNLIYSIPTSSIAYEFTRKVYEILDLNTDNIAKQFNAYDLLNIENEDLKELLLQDKKFSEIELERNLYYIKKGDENMNFDVVIGNPPYQGKNHQQIYPDFYLKARCLSDYVCMIFQTSWQSAKNANNLKKLNNEEVKQDKQIVFINNLDNAFPNVPGVDEVNIILWEKGYDNNLNGKQRIFTNSTNLKVEKLPIDSEEIKKPKEILELSKIVSKNPNFSSIQKLTSKRKPYGLPTNCLEEPQKYGLSRMLDEKQKDSDIKIYANQNRKRVTKFIPGDNKILEHKLGFDKYKVFVPYAWGGKELSNSFSPIIIASPREICSETYLESGAFDDFETAQKHAKYLMTKFCRALLYVNKTSQHSTTSWGAIPVQDYSEDWWSKSIKEIDKELVKKYNVPQNIAEFIDKNLQEKTEDNIVNFYK